MEFVRLHTVCEDKRTHKVQGASGELRFISRSPMSDKVNIVLLLTLKIVAYSTKLNIVTISLSLS